MLVSLETISIIVGFRQTYNLSLNCSNFNLCRETNTHVQDLQCTVVYYAGGRAVLLLSSLNRINHNLLTYYVHSNIILKKFNQTQVCNLNSAVCHLILMKGRNYPLDNKVAQLILQINTTNDFQKVVSKSDESCASSPKI